MKQSINSDDSSLLERYGPCSHRLKVWSSNQDLVCSGSRRRRRCALPAPHLQMHRIWS